MKRFLSFLLVFSSFFTYSQDTKTTQAFKAIVTPSQINGVTQQLSISQLRQIRPTNLDLSKVYYCTEKGKEGEFLPDFSDNSTSDNGAIVIVTQNNIRLKRIVRDNNYFAEWFGAKGDNQTDDTQALQSAINYISTLPKGGTLRLKSSTYLCSHLFLKKGVSITGTNKYSTIALQNSSGTSLKCISNTFQESFVELYPDNSFTIQNGEIDGLAKSLPEFTISNITFDANYLTKYALTIKQAWTFSLDYCKFYGGFAYSLNLTDCNEFKLTNSVIRGFLSISNADYIVEGNDIAGNPKFPALVYDRTGLGNTNNNKIYLAGKVKNFYKLDVKSIYNGIFTIKTLNLLTTNPNWTLFNSTANVTFDEDLQKLTIAKNSPDSAVVVTTLNDAILLKGKNYNLSGTLQLKGISSSRNVKLSCGNVSQIYTNIPVTKNNTVNLDINFYFNPSNNNATSPLKITLLPSSNSSANDTLICQNIKVKSLSMAEIEGIPVVFNYPTTANNSLQNSFAHSEMFYPHFLTDSTLVLYTTLGNYNGLYGAVQGVYNSLQNHFIEIPNSIIHLSGKKNSHSAIFNNNKIEDVVTDAVVCRGCYNYVFSGNTITKGIDSDSSRLFSLIKGATRNTIVGNTISGRINANPTDKASIGIYVDEYSGANKILSNQIANNSYFDIFDNFTGTKKYQNQYDDKPVATTIYQRKATDYLFTGKRLRLNQGKISTVTNNTAILNSDEFTIIFKNLNLQNISSDLYILQQKDITTVSQSGRLNIKINSDRRIIVTINSDVILASNFLLTLEKDYDIAITKDLQNNWKLYIDGWLVNSANSNLQIATTANTGTKTYIGSGEIAAGGDLLLERFIAFKESLTDLEIKNIYSNESRLQTSTYLLDSKVSRTGIFSSNSNSTISESNDSLYVGKSLLINNLGDNSMNLNLSSSITKGNILRVSFYAKSNSIEKIGINRKSNTKFSTIKNSWYKVVEYIYPDGTNASIEGVSLNFGKFTPATFGVNFLTTQGDITLDYFRVSLDSPPASVVLNFGIEDNNFVNEINKSDTYTFVDGMGGFLSKKDVTNNSLKLLRNITASNTSGTDAIIIDNSAITNNLKLYSSLNSKSGSTITIEAEGSNSIMLKQAGSTNAQLFGNGNFAIGTNPSDDGAKLQISGDLSLKSGKIKVFTTTNAPVGNATLASGTVTISTSAATTSSIVYITTKTSSCSGCAAIPRYNYTVSSGSIVITAKNLSGGIETGCADTVSYFIVN